MPFSFVFFNRGTVYLVYTEGMGEGSLNLRLTNKKQKLLFFVFTEKWHLTTFGITLAV
jgi:hypothetical protein